MFTVFAARKKLNFIVFTIFSLLTAKYTLSVYVNVLYIYVCFCTIICLSLATNLHI